MKLSIITIFKFGDLEDLKRTVFSILSQTMPVWETIYVLSSVHSEKEWEFLNGLSDAKIFANVDKSLFNAMNIGLSAATGDAVMFLNGGDEFFSEKSVEYIYQEYKIGVCIGFSVVQYFETDHYLRCAKFYSRSSLILPSHQGFVAPLPASSGISFQENLKIAADSLWMKQLIEKYGIVLSENILTKFQLGGVSNSPTSITIRVRFESQGVKAAFYEFLKYILRIVVGQRWYYRIIYAFKYKKV